MKDENDLFQEIAEQLEREDPRFVRRASALSSGVETPGGLRGNGRTKGSAQLRRVGAVVAMVLGFIVMVCSIALNLPALGLAAFMTMLVGVLPAARDIGAVWTASSRNITNRTRR